MVLKLKDMGSNKQGPNSGVKLAQAFCAVGPFQSSCLKQLPGAWKTGLWASGKSGRFQT